ncbi:MAG: hypothetical protein ACRC33_22375, partial [Gemmataceae bacterium]
GRALDEGVGLFEVRAVGDKDLREALAAKLLKAGFGLRRLDIKRRTLLDRWNEINTMEPAPVPAAAPAEPASPTAVTPAAS